MILRAVAHSVRSLYDATHGANDAMYSTPTREDGVILEHGAVRVTWNEPH